MSANTWCPRRCGNTPGTGSRRCSSMNVPEAIRDLVPAPSLVLSDEDVADSTVSLAETYRRPDTAGVCVADGFGVRVVVERGALEVHMASVFIDARGDMTAPPTGSADSSS